MKKWGLILIIMTSAIGFISLQLHNFAQDSSLSEWHEGLDGYVKSVRLQKDNTKPIAALFYTDWCPNCKKLREDILATTEFREFAQENLITVKINPERGPMENKLAEEFGVFGYPSLFIIPANSQKVTIIRKTSHIPITKFIEQINQAINS